MGRTGCPPLDCDNKVARVDQAEVPGLHHAPTDSCVDVFLPEVGISGSGFFVEKGVDAPVKMASATGSLVTSDRENRHGRAIFGAESGCVAAGLLAYTVRRKVIVTWWC
jgi:hypothetical protein